MSDWFDQEADVNDRDDSPTRFEVIDEHGRVYVRDEIQLRLSYQDGGRTLKVFVEPR